MASRPLAPHVLAALRAHRPAVQPKPAPVVGGARPLAAHVQAAVQAKPAALRPTPRVAPHVQAVVRTAQAKVAPPAVPRPGTVQAALKRTAFSSDTQKAITLASGMGQHRRHIISNHLMKNALNAWWEAHKKDSEGAKTTVKKLQELFDEMNNHHPNLKAGPGAPNSAIGMFTTMAAQQVETFASSSATPMEMETGLSKMRGFHLATQHELIDPVLPVFSQDPSIGLSSQSALPYAKDLMDSTDFDWPDGADPQHFEVWQEAYNLFLALERNAADYDYDGMLAVCRNFLRLPDPGP